MTGQRRTTTPRALHGRRLSATEVPRQPWVANPALPTEARTPAWPKPCAATRGAQHGAATAALKSGRNTEARERNAASGRLLCPKARMRRDGNKSGQMWPKPAITEAAKVVCGVAANATQQKVLCPGLTPELSRAAKRRRLE